MIPHNGVASFSGGVSMWNVRLKYPQLSSADTPQYLGRHGYASCTGLDLERLGYYNPVIRIWPVNSRHEIGRCFVEVPVEVVPALVQALSKLSSDDGG